jgi:hypothetical protein
VLSATVDLRRAYRVVGRLPLDTDLPEEIWLELLPLSERTKRCSGCHEVVDAVHDMEERWGRDLSPARRGRKF